MSFVELGPSTADMDVVGEPTFEPFVLQENKAAKKGKKLPPREQKVRRLSRVTYQRSDFIECISQVPAFGDETLQFGMSFPLDSHIGDN